MHKRHTANNITVTENYTGGMRKKRKEPAIMTDSPSKMIIVCWEELFALQSYYYLLICTYTDTCVTNVTT